MSFVFGDPEGNSIPNIIDQTISFLPTQNTAITGPLNVVNNEIKAIPFDIASPTSIRAFYFQVLSPGGGSLNLAIYKYSRETNQWDKQTFTSSGGQFIGQLDAPLNVGGVNEIVYPSPWLKVDAGKYCIAWRASAPGAQIQGLYKLRSTNRFTGQIVPFPSMTAFRNIMVFNTSYNPTMPNQIFFNPYQYREDLYHENFQIRLG